MPSPRLGTRPIGTLTAADGSMVPSPIWTRRHEPASRLRQRLAAISAWAKGPGHYPA